MVKTKKTGGKKAAKKGTEDVPVPDAAPINEGGAGAEQPAGHEEPAVALAGHPPAPSSAATAAPPPAAPHDLELQLQQAQEELRQKNQRIAELEAEVERLRQEGGGAGGTQGGVKRRRLEGGGEGEGDGIQAAAEVVEHLQDAVENARVQSVEARKRLPQSLTRAVAGGAGGEEPTVAEGATAAVELPALQDLFSSFERVGEQVKQVSVDVEEMRGALLAALQLTKEGGGQP